MATTGFMLYLLAASSVAILCAFSLHGWSTAEPNLELVHATARKVWPRLEFGWRAVVATLIGFAGSAFGTVGGVGGGGIFVPMLTLVVGFDTKSAAAISKCMIMGASTSSVWYNLRVQHPTKLEAPILDYDLALLFQPVLMLGITFGVALSVVFPYWLITLLIIILFVGTSSRAFYKGIQMWKQETVVMRQSRTRPEEETPVSSHGEHRIGAQNEPLIPREEKSQMQVICLNLNWKMMSALLLVWVSFLLIQIFKSNVAVCSAWYWVLFCSQLPIALAVFGYESTKLYREDRRRMCIGNMDAVCEATIQWTAGHITFCAVCGLVGGCVGGLLGSGGGFVLGPLLLELGVIPQVASATATFVMMFSSSLSVVEFYLLKRFPIPYAVYLMTVSILAGFWGQCLIRKLITVLGRASIIVFILSSVIFVSALTMGVVGIDKSIAMIQDHEFMGFLSFCSSQ